MFMYYSLFNDIGRGRFGVYRIFDNYLDNISVNYRDYVALLKGVEHNIFLHKSIVISYYVYNFITIL